MEVVRRLMSLFGRRKPTAQRQEPRAGSEKSAAKPEDRNPRSDGERIVRRICAEAAVAARGWRANLEDSFRWRGLKNDPPQLQIAVLMAAIRGRPQGSPIGNAWLEQELRKAIVSQVLRRSLPFTEGQLDDLLRAWLRQPYSLEHGLPGRTILGAVERHVKETGLSPALKRTLGQLRHAVLHTRLERDGPSRFAQGIADRVARLLDPGASTGPPMPSGAFADAYSKRLAAQPAGVQQSLLALATLGVSAGQMAKPSVKWLTAVREVIARLDKQQLSALLSGLLDDTNPDPTRPDNSLDILKGLIWSSTCLDHGEVAGQIGRFAEKCFRKVPRVGARSVRLGNAALWALSDMADEPRAAAELFRLREKIKYPSARKVIAARLSELAVKSGESVEALEDLALPDFGLAHDSSAIFEFGQARAELQLLSTSLEVRWFNSAGTPVKSVPTDARVNFGGELAAFRQVAKDIEAARAAQVLRLEQAWVEERSWDFATWTKSLLGHPLRKPIVEALIWRVDAGGAPHSVMPFQDTLQDVEGFARDFPTDARVTLWHPLDSDPAQVLAWRRRILHLGVTQPIKQAHREIYVLTDAERRTGSYSNRFAAHILRQHQFRALCQARGWKYDLMGGWDGWNTPTRQLPKQGLKVEYQIQVVEDGQRSAAWVSLHLASDQVRFIDARNRSVNLQEIPPVVFSEVFRDVDLFVAVTSVANDPGWTDGGPAGRHGAYWREWAFGELGQSAATRKELMAWIAPKLAIADKLEIADKFLIVQGQRQKYAIHFGSSNIQILPSNRYLCIVPDGAPPEAKHLKLPFAGDSLLSTILAKAFLLADESKITDQTILRQL